MKAAESVIFLTGGASGLGEGTVRSFIGRGSKVGFVDLNSERGEALQRELGDNAFFVQANVADEEQMKSAVSAVAERFGRINGLVTCAGIGSGTKMLGSKGVHSLDAFTKVIQVNVIGTFNAIRFAAEQIAKNEPNEDGERGVIVCTSSIAAWEAQIGQTAYGASKGAIHGMILPIAREFASIGIRINAIAPGIMLTPQLQALPEPVLEGLAKMIPFPSRLGKPEEFAHLVNSIMENAMINGTIIRQDGAIRMQPK